MIVLKLCRGGLAKFPECISGFEQINIYIFK